jgi:rhodanese-related sulfurtransferase
LSRSASELLAATRAGLERLTPAEALAALGAGGVLVDIRPESRRRSQGQISGSWIVPRNVLEWRFADDEGARDPRLPDRDGWPIVLCDQGYQSSLVAAELQRLGFARATDVIGGFDGWLADGLPVEPCSGVGVTRAIAGGPDDPLPGTYA